MPSPAGVYATVILLFLACKIMHQAVYPSRDLGVRKFSRDCTAVSEFSCMQIYQVDYSTGNDISGLTFWIDPYQTRATNFSHYSTFLQKKHTFQRTKDSLCRVAIQKHRHQRNEVVSVEIRGRARGEFDGRRW